MWSGTGYFDFNIVILVYKLELELGVMLVMFCRIRCVYLIEFARETFSNYELYWGEGFLEKVRVGDEDLYVMQPIIGVLMANQLVHP